MLFDLTISIELKQMNSKDVNAAVDRITRLIGPRLGQGRACLHINVEPVAVARILGRTESRLTGCPIFACRWQMWEGRESASSRVPHSSHLLAWVGELILPSPSPSRC